MKSDFASPLMTFVELGSDYTGRPSTKIDSCRQPSAAVDSCRATPSAALLIARCVAFKMLSLSISAGLADATAQMQPGVDLITSASASPLEIDQLNILNATHLAMRRAADEVMKKFHCPHLLSTFSILVDGLPVRTLPGATNVIKGDAKSLFIAAASILAKTARDMDCFRLEREYPGYGFAKHKGYPTPAHLEALARLGPCPEHRRSFGPVADVIAEHGSAMLPENMI